MAPFSRPTATALARLRQKACGSVCVTKDQLKSRFSFCLNRCAAACPTGAAGTLTRKDGCAGGERVTALKMARGGVAAGAPADVGVGWGGGGACEA
jgi:hypothetical protein